MLSTLPTSLLAGQPNVAAAQPGARLEVSESLEERARKKGEEFEALFLSELLSPIFENLESEGMFGAGQSEEIYRSLLVDEYGKAIAKNGGIGVAEAVQREILKLQEV